VSALGDLAGAAVGGIWKVAAIALAGLLVVGGAAGGTALWMTNSARDKALADLDASRLLVVELRAGVVAQNKAILAQANLAREAEARGKAAQQLAAASAKRFDGALAKLEGARATTCDEAMPAVNQLLKDIK
jgi:predicted O-methyltransferase YrrM